LLVGEHRAGAGDAAKGAHSTAGPFPGPIPGLTYRRLDLFTGWLVKGLRFQVRGYGL
jgi:hypothetical protein